MTRAAEPFTVAVPIAEVDDLRRRLEATRWAEDYDNDDWSYGVERGWLQDMVAFWAGDFDWRAQEAAINALPQFRVEIDGLPIHFVHARATTPDPIPLLLTHGWPWTFWDYKDVIAPLVAAGFDVVVPSLPGIGFSAPRRGGMVIPGIAETWVTLMRDVLGYGRFAAAGGDWGAAITGELGHALGDHLLGIYLMTAAWPGLDTFSLDPSAYAEDEQWMPVRAQQFSDLAMSHVTVARIEPQTLAYALVDSPVGTATWIWERRRAWSEADGDVFAAFDRDFLCTTASIYWLTRSIGTSLRLYSDHFRHAWSPRHDRPRVIEVPTGIGTFPKDIVFVPRTVAERETNLVRWTVLPRGGHYAAAEVPELVVAELTSFFQGLRG